LCYPTGPCPRPAEERCDRWSAADTRETSLAGGECPSSPTPQPNQPTQNPDSSPRQPRLRPSGSPQAAGSQARRLTAATLWIQTVVKRCHWMDGPRDGRWLDRVVRESPIARTDRRLPPSGSGAHLWLWTGRQMGAASCGWPSAVRVCVGGSKWRRHVLTSVCSSPRVCC